MLFIAFDANNSGPFFQILGHTAAKHPLIHYEKRRFQERYVTTYEWKLILNFFRQNVNVIKTTS